MLNPPVPTSRKSCAVARQVEIAIVTVPGAPCCRPALRIGDTVPNTSVDPKPVALAGYSISLTSVISIIP